LHKKRIEIAVPLNKDVRTVQNWENGQISLKELQNVADLLEFDVIITFEPKK
jgi:hypothetical protein